MARPSSNSCCLSARKKFLKTRETEWRHIVHLVHAYCLDYCSIHFELFSDDQQILNCPPAKDLKERAIQLWHYDLGAAMLPLSHKDNDKNILIDGIVSNHQYGQYDRSNIYLFVNHRWIRNNHLIKALLKGYSHVLQPGKFPAAVLSISIDPSNLDVNIHPRKEEVKFLHPQIVENLVTTAVKNTLADNSSSKIKIPLSVEFTPATTQSYTSSRPVACPWQPEPITPAAFITREQPIPQEQAVSEGIELPTEPPFVEEIHEMPSLNTVIKEPEPEEIHNLSILPAAHEQIQHIQVIGQFNKTYIMLEHKDGLMIVDQHAAHERILYEQFAKRFDNIATVKLLFPAIINLQSDDISLLEAHKEILLLHGIIAEPFGTHQIIISSTPVTMQNIDLVDLMKQFVAIIHEHEHVDSLEMHEKITGQLRALMACKAAVKAGDTLTMQQMQAIVEDLSKTDNNLTCPHGRPTSWIIDAGDIEKKFKRDYKGKVNRVDV